jgi:hypothetical protein
VRLGGVRDGHEMLAVCCRDGSRLVNSCLDEPSGGELPDCFEQPVAKAVASLLRLHQALVYQRAEKVGDLKGLDVAEAADRFHRAEVEALGEHCQASQQLLLGRAEQRV